MRRSIITSRAFLALFIAAILAPFALAAQEAPPPDIDMGMMVWGTITARDGSAPDPATCSFTAFIESRPGELVTQDSPGCCVETVGSETQYIIECGNLLTPCEVGDVLIVQTTVPGGEAGATDVTMDGSGVQTLDIGPYHLADTDGDGSIGNFELLDYIDLWAGGHVGNWDLLDAIDMWAAGSYM